MKNVADELESLLTNTERFRQIDEQKAAAKPAPDKWSMKEILGHLIDSAANNHQRFVRMQFTKRLDLVGYDGDEWVRLQRYQDRPWREIVDLWQMYNRHLVWLIRNVDSAAFKNLWRAPEGNDVDLEFVMRDYLVHMRHHLEAIP